MNHLALHMMVKNEEKNILITLNSVKNVVESVIIYDTGSTDNTLQIIETFCIQNNLPFHLLKKDDTPSFTDFSTERNIGLEFVDSINGIDWVLSMDGCDELKLNVSANKLKTILSTLEKNSCLICQEWLFNGATDKYYNNRLFRPKNGLRYEGVVHEVLVSSQGHDILKEDILTLFQDRHLDIEKSKPRYIRDRHLLLGYLRTNPEDPRSLFYLAQTCSSIGDACMHEEAYFYYKQRIKYEGFLEEKFHAYLRLGDVAYLLNMPWEERLKWYMKAFEFMKRIEPIIMIADYYSSINEYKLSYHFLKIAIELPYPEKAILFVNNSMYTYYKWFILAKVCLALSRQLSRQLTSEVSHGTENEVDRSYWEEGKRAAQICFDSKFRPEIDRNLLQEYSTL